MEWIQHELNKTGVIPDVLSVIERVKIYLNHEPLTPAQIAQQQRRAESALLVYFEQKSSLFVRGNVAEKSFKSEGVLIDDLVHMSGKIDLLEIDKVNKTIVVVDYKTGESHESWKPETDKLHKYMIQLYCYKLLVENSASYREYSVVGGRLEFIEPDSDGIVHSLSLEFNSEQAGIVRKLLHALWNRVQTLDMPDITSYGDSLSAIKQFEKDLIAS